MNDQLIQPANENAGDTTEVVETETAQTEAAPVVVEEVKKEYFPSAKLDEAQEAMGKAVAISEAQKLSITTNFDMEKEFPEGYGIAIVPITKNKAGKNVMLAIAIAAIPDFSTLAEAEGGKQFIEKSVVGNMIAKLSNAVRPRGETGETAASIPFSVADFITSNRPEGVLVAFRAYAKAYVKVLKKKGLDFMTESILRQVLQSAAVAKQQFPNIDQSKWVEILKSMINRATLDGKVPGMLDEWLATRDSAELSNEDVDLSDIDFDEVVAPKKAAPEPVAEVAEQATTEQAQAE